MLSKVSKYEIETTMSNPMGSLTQWRKTEYIHSCIAIRVTGPGSVSAGENVVSRKG